MVIYIDFTGTCDPKWDEVTMEHTLVYKMGSDKGYLDIYSSVEKLTKRLLCTHTSVNSMISEVRQFRNSWKNKYSVKYTGSAMSGESVYCLDCLLILT